MSTHEYIVIAVSPFYSGFGWKDEGTGLTFEPSQRIRAVRISKDRDLSGIKNALRLNHLLLLEGKLDASGPIDTEALNPNLLTKKQFQNMVNKMKEDALVDDDAVRLLQEENETLKRQKAELEAKLEAFEDLPEPEEEPAPLVAEQWTEEELLKLTKAELVAIADEKGIDYKESDTKAVLSAKLAGTDK